MKKNSKQVISLMLSIMIMMLSFITTTTMTASSSSRLSLKVSAAQTTPGSDVLVNITAKNPVDFVSLEEVVLSSNSDFVTPVSIESNIGGTIDYKVNGRKLTFSLFGAESSQHEGAVLTAKFHISDNCPITYYKLTWETGIYTFVRLRDGSAHCPLFDYGYINVVLGEPQTIPATTTTTETTTTTTTTTPTASLAGYSVTLDGSIGFNLYMLISNDIAENAKAVIRLPNGDISETPVTETETVPYSDIASSYIFKEKLSAKDMNDDVSIQIVSEDYSSDVFFVSVADYINSLGNEKNIYQDFTDTMLNYGDYADAYFSNTDYNEKNYSDATYNNIAEEISPSEGIKDEAYIGSSLLLKDNVILRHYFSKNITGNMKEKDGCYYVEKQFTPIGYSSKIDNFDFCIYDYIRKVLTNPKNSSSLKNLCVALYNFSLEAVNVTSNNSAQS